MTRFAFAALAVALSLPARAGVVLQYEDDEKKHTTVELEGKKFRSVTEGGRHDGDSAIFDGDKHVFYSLDDKNKTYRRMDESSGTEMAKGIKDAMEQAKAKMTPEQRAQMEAYLKQNKAQGEKAPAKQHTWKYERVGGGQKVAGYSCDNYRVLHDGKLESEGCFVPWGSGSFKKDDFQAFQEMGRFFEKTFATMSESRGQGARRSPGGDWVTHFVDEAPGFPAVMERIDPNGKKTREMRLVKAERTNVSASRFVPPENYKEKPMNMHGGSDD